MAELGEANIGGRMVPAWLLNLTAEELDSLKSRWYNNPNLLDNWYFGNPVNQRGQTSWTNPSNWQYTIDRWKVTPASVVSLADDGITVTADFQQALEKGRLELGRMYTFSVLSSNGRLGKHTFVLTSDTEIDVSFGFGYFVCYLSGDNVWFRIYGDGSTYKAVKLELGSQQTLAHKDTSGNWELNEIPDYGEQLRRCQRYLLDITPNIEYNESYVGICGENYASFCIPTPVSMRTVPVFVGDPSQIQIGVDCATYPTPTSVHVITYGKNYVNIRCTLPDGIARGGMTCDFRSKDRTVKNFLSAEL